MKPFVKSGKRKKFYIYLAGLLCWILTLTSFTLISFQFQSLHGASPAAITSNTLPQITGPQKADGMWSIKIDPLSCYYDTFNNILPSPLGDLVILNSINEVDYLSCIDPNGNTKWIWKEKRASTSAFAYLDNLIETSYSILSLLSSLIWEFQNFNSTKIESLKILTNGNIIYEGNTSNIFNKTKLSLISLRADGKFFWKRNLNGFYTIDADQLIYLISPVWNFDRKTSNTEVVALKCDGEMLWKNNIEANNRNRSNTWIENIDGEENLYTIYLMEQYLRMESIDKSGNHIVEKKEIKISQFNSLFDGWIRAYFSFLGHETKDFSRSNIAYTVITKPEKPTNKQSATESFYELYFSDWDEVYLIDSYNTNTRILEPVIDNVHKQIIVFAQERNPMNHELYDYIYAYDFDGNKKWEKLINQSINLMNTNEDYSDFTPYQVDDNYNIYLSTIENYPSSDKLSVKIHGINADGEEFLHKSIPFIIPFQYVTSPEDYNLYAPKLVKIGYKGQIILLSNTNFEKAPGSYNTLTVLYDKE